MEFAMIQTDLIEKPTIFISFSGGRTSAYMTDILLKEYSSQYNFIVTFANTGQEHNETLEFVRRCDQRWGGIVVWLEAVVNPEKGKGTRHKIVSFETATRHTDLGDDTPFAQVIAKYGIPGMSAPQICTRELKGAVMKSHKREIEAKLGEKCFTAIGIRADEKRRLMKQEDRDKFKVIYPLNDWFETTKEDVLDYWKKQEFDLTIQELNGNCLACWKKSLSKHIQIAKENPAAFDFFAKMEKIHGQTNNKEGYDDRRFFRGHRTVDDIFKLAGVIDVVNLPDEQEEVGGCGESCEASTPEILDYEES